MSAVRARGLVKRFGARAAVDGVDIAVAPGEVHGLLGPNGAGKTTLLRMLFSLIAADAGSVELFGQRLDGLGSTALLAVGGFVEEPAFYPYLSGRANLRLLAQLDGPAAAELIGDALRRLDLEARAGDRVGGYSTGMRQRLGIAAALLRAPRLLLLDEPTSGLDPAGTRAVATLVRELADDGVAVLLSSHQIGELEKVCDSYTVMREGTVVWDGTAERLVAEAPGSAYTLLTTDDERALVIADGHRRVRIERSPRGGLAITARDADLDSFIFAVAGAGVSVRRLELLVSPLESMFFALTAPGAASLEELGPHALAETVLARA